MTDDHACPNGHPIPYHQPVPCPHCGAPTVYTPQRSRLAVERDKLRAKRDQLIAQQMLRKKT